MPLPTGEPGDRGKGGKGKGDKEMSAGKMGEVGDMNKRRMDEAEGNFEKEKEVHPYGDILNLPYPPAGRREKVSLQERAAQFAPFAALTGYEKVIRETEEAAQREMETGNN